MERLSWRWMRPYWRFSQPVKEPNLPHKDKLGCMRRDWEKVIYEGLMQRHAKLPNDYPAGKAGCREKEVISTGWKWA